MTHTEVSLISIRNKSNWVIIKLFKLIATSLLFLQKKFVIPVPI